MSVATQHQHTTGIDGWYQRQDEQFVTMAFSDDLRAKLIRELEGKRWNQHWLMIVLGIATAVITLGSLIVWNTSDRPGSATDILPMFVMFVLMMNASHLLVHYDSKIRLLKLVNHLPAPSQD